MGLLIYEDTRQKPGQHMMKHRWWEKKGVEVVRHKLDYGDYALTPNKPRIAVDTKANMAEIAMNISRQHVRFKNECIRAFDAGAQLYMLIENTNGYTCINDVNAWRNDHCTYCFMDGCEPWNGLMKCPRHGRRAPIQGQRLAKAMSTMQERYGVLFEFCTPQMAAQRVLELLNGVDDG